MYQIKNLLDNNNIKVTEEKDGVKVCEHQFDYNSNFANSFQAYYASRMNIRKRQVLIDLKGRSFTVQSGAMQWMLGDIQSTTGVKGAGDLIGKMFSAKVTGESTIKPVYTGAGYLMLEPTYKHILLLDVAEWGSLVLEDGLFLACDSTAQLKTVARTTLSSAALGHEGLFNLSLTGKGVAVLESPVAKDNLIEVTLNNDTMKIDGSQAIAWSNSLTFTVERSSKTLIGSAVNGEGLVNVYKGTGKILMAPLSK